MAKIRKADGGDLDWLVDQVEEFSKFFGSKKSLFPGKALARDGLANLINHHVLLIATADDNRGRQLGFIGGYFAPHPFNPDIQTLVETFWWVIPEFRGGSAGFRLFQNFVELGKEKGVDWIVVALEAHSPVNPDVLESRGFRLQERSFLMEVS